MTLQGNGLRTVFLKDGIVSSSVTPFNTCKIEVQQGQKAGIRIQIDNGFVKTYIEDGGDVSYRHC
jgi:hypothetical protein